MNITAIIPFKDSLPELEACGRSVIAAAIEHGATEVMLVDNGSSDGSNEVARRFAAECGGRVLDSPQTRVGGLRNLGVESSTGEIVSFVDSDCVVPPDYFLAIERTLTRHQNAAVGSRYLLPDAPHWIESTWHGLHDARGERAVKHINAGNFACLRSTFVAVGGFDERLSSGEDAEICMRLAAAGHPIVETPEIRATHLGNPKTLGRFLRQQRWHAQGMFGTLRINKLDLPVIATLAYLGAAISVPVAAWLFGVPGLLVSLLIFLLVPAATVAYRTSRCRAPVNWPRAILLYHVYFTARSLAVFDNMLRI